MKKVLVISSSPRLHSNSESLAQSFVQGAQAAGHEVEFVTLRGKEIHFCQGCFVCQKTKRCFMHDDADSIVQKMEHADVLAFATPIYYYEMSGQLKTLLDRGNPLYTTNYAFREIFFFASAAENEEAVFQRALSGVKGWGECFPDAVFKESVFAGGVTATDEVKNHPAMKKAYEIGKNV